MFFYLALAVLVLVFASRTIAGFVIEYEWWKEIGQVKTWFDLLLYGSVPALAGATLMFAALWLAHARGLKAGGSRWRDMTVYGRLATLVMLVVSGIVASASIANWTVMQFAGSRGLAGKATDWRDPVFGEPLRFYFFDLPFYQMAIGFVLALSVAAVIAYTVGSRAAQIRQQIADAQAGRAEVIDFRLGELFDLGFLRVGAALVLLILAVSAYFKRYELLFKDHGLLVGVDWVDERVALPLMWLVVAAFATAAVLVWMRNWKLAFVLVAFTQGAAVFIPRVVYFIYVRPTEISIQRPYIERHIQATRAAYGLTGKIRETEYALRPGTALDQARHRALHENVRLWDWQPYHDTITQIQALRPYYVFSDTDVDRYWLPGPDGKKQIQQVLLGPREIDVRQVPEARSRWNNPHFVYTHGYGLVMSRANQATADGLPELVVKNAPPEISLPSIKLTRPEIYYGETVHEPVFVRTGQPEFNYPSGSENVHSKYDGRGGFPVGSFFMRAMAALREGDWNILFTQFMTGESRMMINRNVTERLDALASFIRWDPDPYLVVTDAGRLVWIVDGFTQSGSHPYSKSMLRSRGPINYLRNAVKATVDAYDGSMHIYVFDEADPIIQSYRNLLPTLFESKANMPADLRAHARYPERLFQIQAEIYRAYHMRDPEAFYNKEDLWDVAGTSSRPGGDVEFAEPSFIVATLPGETEPEFLLATAFTPRTKQNLIGLMLARCDGDKLGEIVVLQLSKQELIYGPLQIKARINQDQNISKDLTLWNQQGSKVITGQMQVLPVDDNFLYVQPIYIQSSQAPMPQLKKVAVALGNKLGYADTYGEALAQLGAALPAAPKRPDAGPTTTSTAAPTRSEGSLDAIRTRMRRYRELAAEGKWSEAGRELEAIEALLR